MTAVPGAIDPEQEACVVGGVPVSELAERVGETPFFAYDRERVSDRVSLLRRLLPDRLELSYALKANPMPELLAHLRRLVDGFDVASAGELRLALDAGMEPDRISFAGPGKTDVELEDAVSSGIVISVESELELERLARTAAAHDSRPPIAVRVNPDFRVSGSGMRMGGGPQQFGVDAERVPAVLERIPDLPVELLGFHIFAGSQNLREEILLEAQTRTVELALSLAERAPSPIRYLNLGGGFGIPYFADDEPLDLAAIGEHLGSLLDGRIGSALPEARVTLELGRYVVGEAGVYVTRIVDRKVSRGRTYLVVDGGMHHQLAASGNLGQVIRRNFPVAVSTRGDGSTETVSVVGCLCTPLDLLADQVELPRTEVGDLVIIFQAGAYGFTASPTAFLSHPAPREVLV